MNLKLRALESENEARSVGTYLERALGESSQSYREDPLPPGSFERFLAQRFDAPETLVLVAEAEGARAPMGACITGPLVDPLTGEAAPLILALYVSPELRHRGVARALVREVGRLLSRRKVAGLTARAAHNDDVLISMGERWGFTREWELMRFEP